MKTKILNIIILLTSLSPVHSQSFFTLNTTNHSIPDYAFHNPALAALVGSPSGFIGVHVPVTRFSDDDLRNNFLSYIQPLGEQTAVGLRAQYFTSNIFQNGNYSLLLSRKILGDVLAVGINIGLTTYGYDSDKFHLFDFNDPLIENGTSRQAFTYGVSAVLQPKPGLFLGVSIDHLNKPDISLNKNSVARDRIINLGLSYLKSPIVPQFDIRVEGDDVLTQGGVSGNLLDERLNLYAGYGRFNTAGGNLFAQAQMRFGDLGVLYSYQNPLTPDFSNISGGIHQIGVFYSKSRVPSRPRIELGEVKSIRTSNVLEINASIENKDGLERVVITNNGAVRYTAHYEKGTRRQDIHETVLLDEGDNHIQIKAFAKKTSVTRDILARFEPLPPHLQITSLRNKQVNEQNHQLQVFASDNIALERIEVLHNGRLFKVLSEFEERDSVQVPIAVVLVPGRNDFKIAVYNKWRVTTDSTWIVYQEGEPVPILTIDSPQRPVSGSSSIILNLQMANHQNVNHIIIKINGAVVDSIPVPKAVTTAIAKDRGLGQIVDKDAGLIGEATFVTSEVVAIKEPANLVEATAFDRSGQPRTSQNMRIMYNRHKDQMQYAMKWGIVVGVDNYQEDRIWDLDFAVSDARAVGRLLKENLGFDKIISLFNEQATAENLRAVLSDSLMKVGKSDLVVFYFAGHGLQVENIEQRYEGYLLPHDGAIASPSKNISMEFVRRNSLLSSAKSILYLIDVCYSGLGIVSHLLSSDENKIDYEHLKRRFDQRSRIIIAAGEKDQTAVDGLFANVLRDAFAYQNPDVQESRKADRNGDGYITTTELGRYLQDKVMSEAVRKFGSGRAQKPQIGWWTAERGEVIIR